MIINSFVPKAHMEERDSLRDALRSTACNKRRRIVSEGSGSRVYESVAASLRICSAFAARSTAQCTA